jgi:membrane protein implicated in regulation of membrane protease activity
MSVEAIEFWHWWIAGIVLLGIEIFAPGFWFLWIAVAAGIVGAILFFLPDLSWQGQVLLFAILSVISLIGWRAYQRRYPTQSDEPNLNRRGAQYVGRVFTLDEAIVNGTGKIRVDDTTWKVAGDDRPLGAKVRVTGVSGTVLTVEPA